LAVLTVLFVALLIAGFGQVRELTHYKMDVRYAHDIVRGFHSKRDLALKAEPQEAARYLYELHFPEGQPSPFTGSLSNFVETERRRDVHDIIVYLHAKTGKDLGADPETWIHEYDKQ
jgi:hypothetical protein